MEIKSKDALKDLFKTGKIPTEQNFADFINAYIGTVNGNEPDSLGNVTVPVAYQLVEMFNPSTPPSAFDAGTSVLVFDYDPVAHPEWQEILGADVQPGQQFVITQAYPSEGVFIQQVDTNRDGFLNISLSRTNIVGEDAWGPIVKVNQVRSVNSIAPDDNGNVVVDSGPKGDKGDPGMQGEQGLPGEKGDKGDKGDTGATGLQGPQGETGVQGVQGLPGVQGTQGVQGVQGEEGQKGERGEGFVVSETYLTLAEAIADLPNNTVKDMQFIAIVNANDSNENGNFYILENGTYVFQFKAVGVQGEKGDTGPRGIQGIQGDRGDAGPRGIQGVEGPQGIRGPKGDIGLTPDLVDATTTTKGVVQVGSGLNVNAGVLSVNNQGVTLTTLPTNSPLSAYPNGVVTKNVVISITDADYLYFTGILKTLVGTDLNANQSGGWLRMTSEVIKSGGYGYQTVKINSNVNGFMYPLFELFRSHGTTEWQPWTCNVVDNIGKGAPNGVITGIYGMKYTDVLTNITYIKKGVVDAATSGSWEAINAPKEYSYSSGSTPTSWTLNATANTRITMTGGFTSGITFTGNTFRLKGGKVYKIDLSFGVTTAATSGVIRIGIFNAATNSAADGNKIAIGTGANDKGNKSSTVSIIKPTADTDYYVGIEANSPAGNFTNYSQNMTIVEI